MEGNLIFFTTQWFTIQPDLFGRIEDEVGVLIIRQSPVLRRLCGWESVADVPSESTVSRAYDQFAQDEIASLVHADFVQAALGRNGVFHVSHDSSAIDAREKGQRKPQTEEEKAMTSLGAQRSRTADENFDYFYDLADAGYDAAEIRQASVGMQHVPIIDRNPRRGEKNVDDKGGRTVGIIDATTRRYFVRSGPEQV